MSLSACLRRSLGARPLQAFIAPTSVSAIRPATLNFRPLTISAKLAQEQDVKVDNDAPPLVVETPEENTASPPAADQESIPWYLQVETPAPQQEHPFSERQRLPPLPESPPALLQPILEHVSVELGIDHLSLIDLRELDPPPALGANLLMVIGTARSEKHLHVSADRLCRWLRTEHRLSPFADGLLGRNELKLKLRRKAKRTRLLSAVGAKETANGDVDDGIRTGWVCVNVGRVEGGDLKKSEESHDIVGFGSQTPGSRIVVQMMTEEKRGQIDLETLWGGILRRAGKAQADKNQEVDEAEKRVRAGMLLEQSSSESNDSYRYRPQAAAYPSGQQARAFHSSARATTQQGAQISTTSQLNPTSDAIVQSAVILNHMLDHFKTMSPEDARRALGKHSSDQESTPFLRAFYTAMPRFPEATHWHLHIALRCHAIRLGHPGYSSACVIEDLENMRLACLMPDEATYLNVFAAVMLPCLNEAPNAERLISRRVLQQALAVLDRMFENGYDPVSHSVREILYRATSTAPAIMEDTLKTSMIPSTQSTQEPLALNQLVSALSVYSLRTAAKACAWSEFWDMWRSFPRRMSPRSSDMYVTMFDKVAEKNSQRDAMEALRQCIPEMLRERPLVKIEGQVANAVIRCLQIAEPRAERLARAGNRGEWASLWIQCARALGTA